MNRLGKIMTAFTCAIGCVASLTSCGSKLGGSSSFEKACQNYWKAYEDGDIDKLKEAMAPSSYWEYLEEKNGLPGDRMFYRAIDTESDRFQEYVSEAKKLKIDMNFDVKSEGSCGDSSIQICNNVFYAAGIESMVDDVLRVEPDNEYDMDGYAYHFEKEDCWFFFQDWDLFRCGSDN